MIANKISSLVAASALLAGSLGCSMLKNVAGGNLHEGDNAAQAAQKIKETIGGDVRVIRAEVRPDKLEVTIRSNKNPKDIDKYEYVNGSVKGPEPVQVLSLGELEMTADKYQTVGIDEIGWAALPAAVERAKELSKLEDSKVGTISMSFDYPGHTAPKNSKERTRPAGESALVFTWRLFVEGPRGRKDFYADKSGKINEL